MSEEVNANISLDSEFVQTPYISTNLRTRVASIDRASAKEDVNRVANYN